MLTDKRERLKEMRKLHMRIRAETRDNEMYARESEEMRIQRTRDAMTSILANPDLTSEERKEKLTSMKASIEAILDERDEREHAFIEEELEHHRLEQELEQEIEAEEQKKKVAKSNQNDSMRLQFRARPFLAAGAEQLRKIIEENRKELNEDEQFSTILINNSEREAIPSFVKARRKKEEPSDQNARIDTIVIKQREIGMMYRDSRELQESQLRAAKKAEPPPLVPSPPPHLHEPDESEETETADTFEDAFQTMELPPEDEQEENL
ncbi:MAG: hypothetical protein FWB96_01685 [Defluviitaleaceae bacterium]|nr:hypothetical protein [Defluviitaleaceae bacterium]MCL2261595.1 hypothetical protein [Defluviitaleaceae bacterium]